MPGFVRAKKSPLVIVSMQRRVWNCCRLSIHAGTTWDLCPFGISLMSNGMKIWVDFRSNRPAAQGSNAMRHIFMSLLLLSATATPLSAAAQESQRVADASLQLVVFNRPGEKWAERASAVPLLIAHRDIYLKLAASGEIAFSGRFVGEPLLGMSIFTAGIDRAAIQRQLENDPAVVAGYIALEFRIFAPNSSTPATTEKQPAH
jgi:uncharacterized protein YciI